MKKQLFHILILVPFLVLSIITLQSCTKGGDNNNTPNCGSRVKSYSISDGFKAQIPYSGYDTITMVSNTGDTIRCIGGGKRAFTTHEFEGHIDPACAPNGTDIYYEAYEIKFIDSSKKVTINLSQYDKQLSPKALYNAVEVIFKKTNFRLVSNLISNPQTSGFIPSIELNNVVFKDVNKFPKGFFEDSSSFVLINKTDGILQFNLNQNEIWTVLK